MLKIDHPFFDSLKKAYESVPHLECGECWGECCVSPTMTATEFVFMMENALLEFSQTQLKNYLTETILEHKYYPGNSWCRFQNNQTGRCENYNGRALACRLHGHEVLRVYAGPEMEFCSKQPDPFHNLKQVGLDSMLNIIRDYSEANSLYSAPYYFVSLNLESWIDFYYQPEISANREILSPIWNFLVSSVELPLFEKKYTPLTTLSGKLNAIDRFYHYLNVGFAQNALEEILSIQNDYPSVGSYYLDEARQFEKEIKAFIEKQQIN